MAGSPKRAAHARMASRSVPALIRRCALFISKSYSWVNVADCGAYDADLVACHPGVWVAYGCKKPLQTLGRACHVACGVVVVSAACHGLGSLGGCGAGYPLAPAGNGGGAVGVSPFQGSGIREGVVLALESVPGHFVSDMAGQGVA